MPVAGVSWYEAAAYAEFAGKSLPTMIQWRAAAGLDGFARNFGQILRLSNFGEKGPSAAGRHERAGALPGPTTWPATSRSGAGTSQAPAG